MIKVTENRQNVRELCHKVLKARARDKQRTKSSKCVPVHINAKTKALVFCYVTTGGSTVS